MAKLHRTAAMPRTASRLQPTLTAALASLLVLCTASVLPMADAVKGTFTWEADRLTLAPFEQFGFDEGGSISLSVSYTTGYDQRPPVYFIACSLTSLDDLLTTHNTIEALCPNASPTTGVDFNATCEWAGYLTPSASRIHFDGEAKHTDFYEFVYLNCDENDAAVVDITFDFVNPGGENLSTGDVPFKVLCVVYLGIWSGVVVLWGLNWVCQRRRSVPLYLILGVTPVLHCLTSGVLVVYWRSLSATGEASVGLYLLELVVSGCSTAALLSTLVLVAKGYNITRPTLVSQEWRSVWVMAIVFVVCYFTWQLLTGFFFLFLLILVYVLVLRFLFASVAANVSLIEFQLRFLHGSRPEQLSSSSLPARQIAVVKRFRSALALYLGVDIMLHVWSTMALQRSPWAEFMLVESCTLLLVLYMLVDFRLRQASPYYTSGSSEPLLPGSVGVGALAPESVPTPQAIIIQNPDTTDPSGKMVRSVAVGVPTYTPTYTRAVKRGGESQRGEHSRLLDGTDGDGDEEEGGASGGRV